MKGILKPRAIVAAALTVFGFVNPSNAATLYSTQVLARNPIVYFTLDDAAGPTATDSSGHAYNGTYDGGNTYSQPSASAQLGTSIHTNPAITNPVNAAIPLKITDSTAIAALNAVGTNSFSIEFWFNTSNITDREDLFDFRATVGGNDLGIQISNAGGAARLNVVHPTTILTETASDPAITKDAWHHLVLTRDTALNQLKLYVDGAKVGPTVADTQTFAMDPAAALALGNKTSGAPHLALGYFDDFAIYNTALSAADVAADFTLGSTGTVPEPTSLAVITCAAGMLLRRRNV